MTRALASPLPLAPLAPHSPRLGLLHPGLPIIQLLQRQAAEVSASMLAQLLQRLRGSIQVRTRLCVAIFKANDYACSEWGDC